MPQPDWDVDKARKAIRDLMPDDPSQLNEIPDQSLQESVELQKATEIDIDAQWSAGEGEIETVVGRAAAKSEDGQVVVDLTIDEKALDEALTERDKELLDKAIAQGRSNRAHMRDEMQERVELMSAQADLARALVGIGVGSPYRCMNLVKNMSKKPARTLASALNHYVKKLP